MSDICDEQTEGFRSGPIPSKAKDDKRMPQDKAATTKQNNNLHVILQILPGNVPAKISDVDTSALVLGTGNKSTTTGTAGSATLLLGVVSAAGGTLAVLTDEDLAAHELGIVEGEDGTQSVRLRSVEDIPDGALRAIKKIKVTPGRNGDQVEVELVDKVRVLQMLAKAAGLLEQEKEADKPSVVSIEMVMPKDDGDA